MKRRRDEHARWRELGAAALDRPISTADAAELDAHLVGCPVCRAAVRDYREQRHALRALPQHLPPRDLSARTSAALDREIARDPRRHGRTRARTPGVVGGAFVASVTLVGLSLALVGTQTIPVESPRVPTGTAAGALRPTPFTIPSEALAFVGSGIDGLSVYRTRVDRVCPATFIDCVDYPSDPPAVVALPRDLRPSNVALNPNGASLAIQARERDGGQTIAVVAIPADDLIDAAGPSNAPGVTLPPTPISTPGAAPSATPVFASVSSLPIQSAASEASLGIVPPSLPNGSDFPLATADPAAGDDVVAILEDVIGVGAPPAWSADGTALAFSAMPADRSHGPDIYIWRPTDARATPLTTDHASYFASWSGYRIVGSRVTATGAGDGATPPAIDVVVIDAETREQRTRAGVGLWLPNVSPLGTHAVGWKGTLDVTTNEALPIEGELFIADWPALDPFAANSVPDPSPADPSAPSGSPALGHSATAAAGASGELPADSTPGTDIDAGGETADPMASSAAETPDPSVTPDTESSLAPTGKQEAADDDAGSESDDEGETTSDASPTPEPEVPASDVPAPAVDLVAVESGRDPEAGTVQDWQVRWSVDGTVLGYWIADVPGASWGRLAVVTVDAETGDLAHDEPLLAPSLARRAFTLGMSRVAWVAPSDAEPDGELRIRTWGPDGSGGLRLRPLPPGEVIPAS